MARNTSIEVHGLEDLEGVFDRLQLFAQKTVLLDALKAGAKIVADEAKTLVPEDTGRLKKAIRVRLGRSKKGNMSVLAAVGKRWFAGDTFYGAFQEFGTKNLKGEHFMQYAFESKAAEAMRVIVQNIRAGIAAEIGGK